jgi:hypothetical protein
MIAFAAAQAPPAAAPAAPAKNFKDKTEEAEAIAANTEKDPKAQLEKLDKWKNDYPTTEYDVDRLALYFSAYGTLKQFHDQVIVAQQIRKTVPGDLLLLRTIFVDVAQIKPPTADDLAALSDAANYVIGHADEIFDAAKKPADQTPQAWSDLKPQFVAYAKNQLDFVAQTQGEAAMLARLKEDPSRVVLNGVLGALYRAQGKADPKKLVLALFHYGRVAVYDGPNAASAADRAGSKKYFDVQYKGYHGSMDGAEDVLGVCKANSTPPDGFAIRSITEISQDKIKEDEEKRKANPMMTLWTDTKTALLADPAAVDAIKGAEFPGKQESGVTKFKGKIISMTPALRPKKLVLAVEKDGVADCTLLIDAPLAGKMDAGDELEFSGTVKDVAKDPYMLTFDVEKANLDGWKGKNAPGPARAPKKGN